MSMHNVSINQNQSIKMSIVYALNHLNIRKYT